MCLRRSGSPAPRSEEQESVEASYQPDASDNRASCKERPGHVRRCAFSGLVTQYQPLAILAEDDLGRDRIAREAHRMNVRPGDRRTASLARSDQFTDMPGPRGRADVTQPLRQLSCSPPAHVDLAPRVLA